MISIDISGWGTIEIENIVIDLNGTLATDGKIPPAVKDKVNILSKDVKIFVLTADTQGTAKEESMGMNVELIVVPDEDSKRGKFDLLKTLDLERTIAIGNGNNDQIILKEAGLSIGIIGDEGLSQSAIKNSDIITKSIIDALDLFLKPKRLIATLKE